MYIRYLMLFAGEGMESLLSKTSRGETGPINQFFFVICQSSKSRLSIQLICRIGICRCCYSKRKSELKKKHLIISKLCVNIQQSKKQLGEYLMVSPVMSMQSDNKILIPHFFDKVIF